MADERADAAARRGKEKAADGMGGAAEEAPGGTGAEVRGDAETLRAGNCPRSRSGEGARPAYATRKASPPKNGWRPQRRARGSECGRRAASVRVARGPRQHGDGGAAGDPGAARPGSASSRTRIQQAGDAATPRREFGGNRGRPVAHEDPGGRHYGSREPRVESQNARTETFQRNCEYLAER